MMQISLNIHSTVKNKTLIRKLFKLGMCVSYNWVLVKDLFTRKKDCFLDYIMSFHSCSGLHDAFSLILRTEEDSQYWRRTILIKILLRHFRNLWISIFVFQKVLCFPNQGKMVSELPATPIPDHVSYSQQLWPLPKNYTYVEKNLIQPSKINAVYPPFSNRNQIDLACFEQ